MTRIAASALLWIGCLMVCVPFAADIWLRLRRKTRRIDSPPLRFSGEFSGEVLLAAERRARRQLLELLEPPDAPNPSLIQEIVDVLINAIGEASPEARVHGVWRMSTAWKQRIIDAAKWDKPHLTLYGHPVVIDDSTLAPVLCTLEGIAP